MYEPYSRQSLPEENYRALLGSAICVFNSNLAFIVENMLRDDPKSFDWGELINLEGGKLQKRIKQTSLSERDDICSLFKTICLERNRIVHSFQITNAKGEQVLATRDKNGIQFEITEEYLLNFIAENERLSSLLHAYRGW